MGVVWSFSGSSGIWNLSTAGLGFFKLLSFTAFVLFVFSSPLLCEKTDRKVFLSSSTFVCSPSLEVSWLLSQFARTEWNGSCWNALHASVLPVKKGAFVSCASGASLDCSLSPRCGSRMRPSCSTLWRCLVALRVPAAQVGAARRGWKLWWGDSDVHQQKQNVISIGKYFKVFQTFKMKQNLSLQNISSSHCSSLTCTFQGKQIDFELKWLMLKWPTQTEPCLLHVQS